MKLKLKQKNMKVEETLMNIINNNNIFFNFHFFSCCTVTTNSHSFNNFIYATKTKRNISKNIHIPLRIISYILLAKNENECFID